jgi:hypothetical protein
MLRGSTLKKMVPYNFFYFNDANTCVALPKFGARTFLVLKVLGELYAA